MVREQPDIVLLYQGNKMVHFTGGKQRNKDHKRGVDEPLKGKQERFDPCCIHIVSLAINHLDKKG